MKIYKLEAKQILSVTKSECWKFFSDPNNLQAITPPDMDFEIKSDLPAKVYPGQIIIYRIKLFPGIKVSWVTEITQVIDEEFFIDEQRFGPYKFWHHQHRFHETEDGIEMQDTVHYAIPFGTIGQMIHSLIIKRKLNYIFQYRRNILEITFVRQSE